MQEVDADAWFYPSQAERIGTLYEDSIYLQNYGAVFTLLWAVSGGWYDCALELLSAGADPDLADATGRTPLHAAARQGRLQLVRLLLEHGADADLVDASGHTAWAIADAWVGIDLEAELRNDLLEHAPPGSVAECRRTITVEVRDADGRRASSTLECSHPEIAALLSSS